MLRNVYPMIHHLQRPLYTSATRLPEHLEVINEVPIAYTTLVGIS
jgi:hypothetical protein